MPFEEGGLHVLPGKALLDPVGARVDQYGQLPKGTMSKLTVRSDVFVGEVHGSVACGSGSQSQKPHTHVQSGQGKRLRITSSF
jgi:hypothetical protein